jgi:hypothetical protein|tara:strand:+ start:3323 stop:3517 length:195 start_codon:yes stop_codon:yes gene_type:complete
MEEAMEQLDRILEINPFNSQAARLLKKFSITGLIGYFTFFGVHPCCDAVCNAADNIPQNNLLIL